MKSLRSFLKEATDISEQVSLDPGVVEKINEKISKPVKLDETKMRQLFENWTKHFRKFDSNFPDLNVSIGVHASKLVSEAMIASEVKFGEFENLLHVHLQKVGEEFRVSGFIR